MNPDESDAGIEFQSVQHKKGLHEKPRFVEIDRTFVGPKGFADKPNEIDLTIEIEVLRQMASHSISNTKTELGGVLVGVRWSDHPENGSRGVWIGGLIRAEAYQATRGSFTFTHESWSRIAEHHSNTFPQYELVGWYHTHPGWGIFLSSYDRFICDHFFPNWFHIALVLDPLNGIWGVFDRSQLGSPQTRDRFFLKSDATKAEERDRIAQMCSIAKSDLFHLSPFLQQGQIEHPTMVRSAARQPSQDGGET